MHRLTHNFPTRLAILSSLMILPGCYSMNGYVMNASGQGYYEQGNYAMAAQEFQTALASRPNNPDYMANLAKARSKMGDANGAEQLYRQALTTSPSHQPSYHGYSELLLAQGREQEALRMMNTWAATQPYIAESHVELAWLQRELGQHDAAARSLETALQANPNHATALAHLGQHYQDVGRPDQAIAMYQRSLQANWNQPEVQSKLAAAASAVGPNHPMGEIAMARGVHPHSVPRQQLAIGQPTSSMAMAGFSATPQQAMNPYPMMPGQPQLAQQTPQFGAAAGPVPFMQSSAMPVQPAAPFAGMPTVFNGGSEITMLPSSPVSPSANDATPSPVPDPAFLNSAPGTIPATSVSQSTEVSNAVPEVSAF